MLKESTGYGFKLISSCCQGIKGPFILFCSLCKCIFLLWSCADNLDCFSHLDSPGFNKQMHWAHKDAVMLAFHVGLSIQTPFISSFDIDTKAETLAI